MKRILGCLFGLLWAIPSYATLPAGYTELEYIESTGTQYIDTGLKGNNTYTYKFTYQKTEQNNPSALFGDLGGTAWNTGYYFAYSFVSANGTQSVAYFSDYIHDVPQSSNHMTNGVDLNKHTYECKPITQKQYLDGVEYVMQSSTTTVEWESNKTLFVFCQHNMSESGTPLNKQKLKVWEFSVKNGDVYVQNLIPARRNSDGEIGMYDTVSGIFFENAGTGDFIAGPIAHCETFGANNVTCTACKSGYKLDSNGGCVGVIEVATTKMVDDEFAPLDTALANAISVVDNVVTQTIAQAGQIATLQNTKQTRPDDDDECPAGKKCLLVTDENGKPHWYQIFDPIHEWLEAFFVGNPNGQYVEGGVDFRRWQGNPNFRETYIDGSKSVNVRQWTATTPARTVGGMYQTLGIGDLENAGTWAVEFDGTEASTVTSSPDAKANPGVAYGIAKCTTVSQGFATKLSAANQAAFYELPAQYGQTDRTGYERENFKQCWCKMTAIGVPGEDGTAANGSVYPINAASSSWVFSSTRTSAANCAYDCAHDCANSVRNYASFRSAVFGLAD